MRGRWFKPFPDFVKTVRPFAILAVKVNTARFHAPSHRFPTGKFRFDRCGGR